VPVEHFRNHPDIHQPWSEWSEDERIHIVGVYNNPFRWRKRRELFNDWRRHMMNSPNVELYVVELAYGNRPHEVTDPNQHANDIQLRTDCEMWRTMAEEFIEAYDAEARMKVLTVWGSFKTRAYTDRNNQVRQVKTFNVTRYEFT